VAFDINSYLQGYKDAVRDFAAQGLEMTATQAMSLVEQDIASEASAPKKKRRSRTARAQDKKMSRALAQANDKLRKNNGELRKGVTQADIMILAHKIKKTL